MAAHVIPPSPTRQAASNDPWLLQFGAISTGANVGFGTSQPAVVSPVASPSDRALDADARLRSIEHQLKSLEKRVVGDGIRIGRFLFQSREDLRLWLVTHVPSNRFGLFLDGVSIFDFLAQTHMDSQENMAHLYNSQRNGFDTIYESKIISSMQNLFPNLFGKSGSDGMDTSKTLPGLQTSDKWNSAGVTGLQIQVERELPNVDLQFRNAILATFEDSSEVRDLALELLYRSKKFALDLCNFMQRDVDFWKHKGYTKQSAWELTCLSVCRIFEDIHVVPVVGRDSRDLKNPSATATQILWATLRSHLVMDEYSRRNFVEHPSISAVIARHLASHHTRPDDTLESKFRKLEEKVVKYTAKVDSIKSRLAVLESKVDEAKNEDSPLRKQKGGGKAQIQDQDRQGRGQRGIIGGPAQPSLLSVRLELDRLDCNISLDVVAISDIDAESPRHPDPDAGPKLYPPDASPDPLDASPKHPEASSKPPSADSSPAVPETIPPTHPSSTPSGGASEVVSNERYATLRAGVAAWTTVSLRPRSTVLYSRWSVWEPVLNALNFDIAAQFDISEGCKLPGLDRQGFIFMSGPWAHIGDLWKSLCASHRLWGFLDLGSVPDFSSGRWFKARHLDFDGITDGCWWWGTSFSLAPSCVIEPSPRRLIHVLSPLPKGRPFTPVADVMVERYACTRWLQGCCHPGGLFPAKRPHAYVVSPPSIMVNSSINSERIIGMLGYSAKLYQGV